MWTNLLSDEANGPHRFPAATAAAGKGAERSVVSSRWRLLPAFACLGLAAAWSGGSSCHAQLFDEQLLPSQSALTDETAPSAFDRLSQESVLTELQLNNAQREKIKSLIDGLRSAQDELKKSYDERLKGITAIGEQLRKRAEFRTEMRQKIDALRSTSLDAIVEVLETQQKETYEAKYGPLTAAATNGNQSAESSSGTTAVPSPSSAPSGTSNGTTGSSSAAKLSDTPKMLASFATNGQKASERATQAGPDRTTKENGKQTADPLSSLFPKASWNDLLRLFSESAGQTSTEREQATTEIGPQPADRLSFRFHDAPWTDVLKLFAEAAGLTLNLKDVPPGKFTYYDRQEYTPTQALDIMNRFLLQQGYILVRHDRFLTALSTKEGIPPNLIETVTPDALAVRGSTELLRVALPLGDRDSVKAAEEVRALLGPQGKVAPLESAGSIVVTDIAANLRRVQQLLTPPPKVGAAEMTFRAFPLKSIDAPAAADMIRSLFGLQSGVQNVSAGQSGGSSSGRSSRSGFDPQEFFRMRFGGGGDSAGEDRSRSSSGSSSSQQQSSAAQSRAKVAVDLRTNSVLVTATAAEMKLVEEIVQAVDVDPGEEGRTTAAGRAAADPYLQVYELKTADAQEVAKTLGVLHPGMVVNEDGRAKRIHVWATPEKQREIEAHVRQLDGAAAGETVAIIPLIGLNPYDVSTTLTSLYAADPAGAPAVQVDPSGFGLMVRGSVVQISQIRTLVDQMAAQGPSNFQKAARVVPIGSSRSAYVQQAIGTLYPQVTISTTAPSRTATLSTTGTGSSRNGSSASSSEDAERQERARRFMEFRERFFGGSSSSRDGRDGSGNSPSRGGRD